MNGCAGGGTYALTIFVDRCSVEVFAQDGRATMTELIFPAETSTDPGVIYFCMTRPGSGSAKSH